VANEAVELSWFIEIDLATESSTVLKRKFQTYTDYWRSGREQRIYDVFPRVFWIAPDIARAQFITRSIKSAPDIEARLFTVTTAQQAVDLLTNFSGTAQ